MNENKLFSELNLEEIDSTIINNKIIIIKDMHVFAIGLIL